MPVIQQTISVPANGVVDNAIQGSQFEFMPYDAALRFGLSASAVGLVADVYSGQDVLAEQMAVAPTNRLPINPDDFVLSDVAGAGERIKVRLRNTTGAAIGLNFSVIIDPI